MPQKWWIYADKRPALYAALSGLDRILIVAQVSRTLAFAFVPNGWIYSHKTVVFPTDKYQDFAVLQSNFHSAWAWSFTATLKEDLSYFPTDCFLNYPFPQSEIEQDLLTTLGKEYHEYRRQIMLRHNQGLTKSYNRFHDPEDSSTDIVKLRDLHIRMDRTVAAAYRWSDLDLGHGFHQTKQGIQFRISESARREVLTRLLKLNHERYLEEVRQGLHDSKKGKTKAATSVRGRKSKHSTGTPNLFGDDEDDPDPAPENEGEPKTAKQRRSRSSGYADPRAEPSGVAEPPSRPTPIEEFNTHEVMAASRHAFRCRGSLNRDELFKRVSLVLGYQRLSPKTEEALRGHLRVAIRRRIINSDGPALVHTWTATMADNGLVELRECFRYVIRRGTRYVREKVVLALAIISDLYVSPEPFSKP